MTDDKLQRINVITKDGQTICEYLWIDSDGNITDRSGAEPICNRKVLEWFGLQIRYLDPAKLTQYTGPIEYEDNYGNPMYRFIQAHCNPKLRYRVTFEELP